MIGLIQTKIIQIQENGRVCWILHYSIRRLKKKVKKIYRHWFLLHYISCKVFRWNIYIIPIIHRLAQNTVCQITNTHTHIHTHVVVVFTHTHIVYIYISCSFAYRYVCRRRCCYCGGGGLVYRATNTYFPRSCVRVCVCVYRYTMRIQHPVPGDQTL